jgi:hypothetical protein
MDEYVAMAKKIHSYYQNMKNGFNRYLGEKAIESSVIATIVLAIAYVIVQCINVLTR